MAARTPGVLPSLGTWDRGSQDTASQDTAQEQDGRLEERAWTERRDGGGRGREAGSERAWHTEELGEEGESRERNPRERERERREGGRETKNGTDY